MPKYWKNAVSANKKTEKERKFFIEKGKYELKSIILKRAILKQKREKNAERQRESEIEKIRKNLSWK